MPDCHDGGVKSLAQASELARLFSAFVAGEFNLNLAETVASVVAVAYAHLDYLESPLSSALAVSRVIALREILDDYLGGRLTPTMEAKASAALSGAYVTLAATAPGACPLCHEWAGHKRFCDALAKE